MFPLSPLDEQKRLGALRRLDVLDTPIEGAFERLTSLASRLFDTPIALISFVDNNRQWFKSHQGVDFCETPLSMSFCTHTIQKKEHVLVVPDATTDTRFCSNPLVTGESHIRFYAGAPLISREGQPLGSLCILDTKARDLNDKERQTLVDLAAVVVDELELRLSTQNLVQESKARHIAEKELLDSQMLFKSAFQLSATGMALVSPEGHWLQVNEELCRILGYSEIELLSGMTWKQVTYSDDLESNLELKNQLLSGRIASYEMEKRYMRRDGEVIWVSLSVAAVRDDEGTPLYLVAQVQDISGRKQIEDDLRQSEALKAGILETALDGVITINSQSLVVEWNPAAEKIFGYRREEAVGQPMQDLIVPSELRAAHSAGLQRYLETGEGPVLRKRLELPAICSDGRTITVELAIVPIPNSQPPLFTGHVRDITERRATLEALRESEARYHRIAANVPGMVYQLVLHTDGSLSFNFVSDGCRDIYGVEPEELMADSSIMPRLIHPDDVPQLEATVMRSAQLLEPWEWQGRMELPSGQIKWIRGTSRPKREEDGRIIWDGILFDVTPTVRGVEELKAAKIEAETARIEAERANAAKSEFLSRMSHELRTPLNAIIGFGQLLENQELPNRANQQVGYILKGGYHLLSLINEVLDIARIETGHLVLAPEPVRVSEVVSEALELVQPMAQERSITLHNALCHRTCSVFADHQRLKQILLNLLSNAVKYNREGGSVSLSCYHIGDDVKGSRLCLEVKDTGLGISPEDYERVWIPFERLGAESKNIEGTGIGLPLSRRLAEAMNGTIALRSVVGQGSTFTLSLPSASLETDEIQVETPSIPPSTCHVALYIESDLSNLRLLQAIWADHPEIRLLSARQGGTGLELARVHQPDVILLDLPLRDMSGEEVVRQLKSEVATRDIPVVAIGSKIVQPHIESLRALGVAAYLPKPLDIDLFRQVLGGLLERGKNRDCCSNDQEGQNVSLAEDVVQINPKESYHASRSANGKSPRYA